MSDGKHFSLDTALNVTCHMNVTRLEYISPYQPNQKLSMMLKLGTKASSRLLSRPVSSLFWLQYFPWLPPSLFSSWFFWLQHFFVWFPLTPPFLFFFLAPILSLSFSFPFLFLIFLALTFLSFVWCNWRPLFSLSLIYFFLSSPICFLLLSFLFSPFLLFSLPSLFFGSWIFFGSEPGSQNIQNFQACPQGADYYQKLA